MSMREETRRRLSRALWIERLRWVAIGAAVVVVMAAVLTFTTLDSQTTRRTLPAVVEHVDTLNSKNASQGVTVAVKLEDGREINVIMLRTRHPTAGDEVEIVEHKHATGRITYTFK